MGAEEASETRRRNPTGEPAVPPAPHEEGRGAATSRRTLRAPPPRSQPGRCIVFLLLLRRTHALIHTTGLWRKPVLSCKLISSYGRLLNLRHARKSFELMPATTTRAFNCILKAHVDGGQLRSALDLYSLSLPPTTAKIFHDAMTFSVLLRGCSDLGWARSGLLLHAHLLVTGSEPDLHLATDLVHFYLKFSRPDHAQKVFAQTPHRDLVLWTTMVDGFLRNGEHGEAMRLFSEMRASGLQVSAAAWNALVAGYARGGMAAQALCQSAVLSSGAAAHGFALRRALEGDLFVVTALVDMYGKCGKLSHARRLFELAGDKDAALWNAVILAHGAHGDGEEALPQRDHANRRPLACNHAGMVDEARRLFQSMAEDHGLLPSGEHFSCMVDLLGRAGRLQEAFFLVTGTPAPPPEQVRGALLAACRTHLPDAVPAQLDLPGGAAGVMLSNIYAESGRWEEMARVRTVMRDAGVKKTTAFSWIEVGGAVHAFKVFDALHPQMEQIYEILSHLEAVVRLEHHQGGC
ncbi:unnamed protein product [Spirodela intermedia]|uniref:Uncharacterized protein n=1 Tax=Spirodela intermedia TaxID=51605 RepID=A0A7I8INC7_SPIIN|nr:unnamed protein product [Spirodela intermedia]CAA6659366.1 unnamed protein product [Spirodela intermedia]